MRRNGSTDAGRLNGFPSPENLKTFDLPEQPERFVVHVSADNRYKLYVNGELASVGPARGDVFNWNFETVDLARWLKPGKNTLAAVVWNFAEMKPVAQVSFNQTGLIVQGNTAAEEAVNTNDSWLCSHNDSYKPHQARVYGYYAAGPGEQVDAAASRIAACANLLARYQRR